MKVLLVDHESKLGGAEVSMVSMAKNMPRERIKYSAAIAGEGEFAEALRESGVESVSFHPMDGWRWWVTGAAGRLKLLLSLPVQIFNTIHWIRFLKKEKPDLVHFNLSRLVEPVWAAAWLKIPSILHYREGAKSNSRFFGGLKALFRHFSLCNVWIANSDYTRKAIEPFKRKRNMLYTVNNAIEIAPVPVRTYPYTKGKKVIGKIGTIVPIKNYELFIDLARLICNKSDEYIFVIAGKGSDEYLSLLKNKIQSLDLQDKIIFAGFFKDINSFFSGIDVLVHTSGVESFGRVYIEAMAMQKPVFAIKGDAGEYIIRHGETGFLYDASELQQMADSIISLCDQLALMNAMGSRGREYVIENFSIEKMTKQLEDIYINLYQEGRAS